VNKLIFSTNSNLDLANSIASITGSRLGKRLIERFADQEMRVRLQEPVQGQSVYVVGSNYVPHGNFVELLILINTLKVNGASEVTLVIPYLGYAKQDHIDQPGAALSAKLMIQCMELAGSTKIIAVDLHSMVVEKFFSVPLVHLTAIDEMFKYFTKNTVDNLAVVSADLGAIERAKKLSSALGNSKVIIIEKHRPKFDQVDSVKILGEVKDKNVVIIDDMIQTGNTIDRVTASLKENGARDIYVAATHFVYKAGALDKLANNNDIKKIIVTDTIPPIDNLPEKVEVISVDKLIASAIS